jgi:gamma-glutamyltranspeptidase / glutathione hydrolase
MTLNASRLMRFREAASIYLRDGQPYALGERPRHQDYAGSLPLIARDGPEAFHRGPIATAIIGDMREGAGAYRGDEALMTLEDLRAHEPASNGS